MTTGAARPLISAHEITTAAGVQAAGEKRTVQNGVYTEEQAKRGKAEYRRCLRWHLESGEGDASAGVTPIAGPVFLGTWSTRTLKELFDTVKTTMPMEGPGGLTPNQCVDLISYILQLNKFPTGNEELPVDPNQLDRIIITEGGMK